jgi:hypothetical protein
MGINDLDGTQRSVVIVSAAKCGQFVPFKDSVDITEINPLCFGSC